MGTCDTYLYAKGTVYKYKCCINEGINKTYLLSGYAASAKLF